MAIRAPKSAERAVTAEAVDSNGARIVVRITSPAPEVFRLCFADASGSFREGAIQILSGLPGSSAKSSLEPISVRELPGRSAHWEVISPTSTGFLRLGTEPFSLELRRGTESPVTAVSVAGSDGTVSWIAGPLGPDERLYGTGERFNGTNQRGKKVRIWAVDRWCQTEGNSYVPIPFILSSAGWGALLNRYEASELDLGATSAAEWRIGLDHAPLDVYLFLDATPAGTLAKLSLLTGRAPMPAEWTFGVHVCRHARLKEFGTREGVMAMVRAMEDHRLPWSSVILEGWDTYDARTYGELKALVAELHAMGKKALMYEPCGRLPDPFFGHKADDPELYLRGQEARPEYFVKGPDGSTKLEESAAYNPADAPNRRSSTFLDLTSPAAVRWWAEVVWGRLVRDIGIDGAKIDFCEQFPEWDGVRFADGRSPRGMHHLYPVLYNAMMYELYRKHRPEGGMCFSRGGSTGAHLYPFIWCGDQLREWRFLRAILSSLLSAGLSGVPFLCHDLAAYMPTKDAAANVEERVFARGTEMGCFTVNMQTHGIVTRPYEFSPAIVDIYRLYSRIHYALVPYLQEQAAVSCATGLPLTRHLVVGWPQDREVWDLEDEYLLGSDLLVAPVLDDREERDVYLPAGEWEGLGGGDALRGPRKLERYPAPLDSIPVFVRRGGESKRVAAFAAESRRLLAAR